ncbi:carbohydrate binding family 9 domain-containing protein [Acidobacteria bacterium AH-259-D05]|nr:carbohydrate binding family 9 domain-containing protein [Acidobacteria bacterium AH-259-D05]
MGWFTASTFGSQLDFASGNQEKKITASRIQQAIVIDGTLDEPQWELAKPVRDFVQQEPRIGEPVSELTEVRLLYDNQNLYVGIYCFDSEGEKGIVVSDMRRDFLRPLDTDGFAIILDTFDDNRNAFFFNTNARGAKSDQQIGDDGGKRNRDWDGIWHVKTKINESGWQAEIAIPFKTLRFPNKDQQSWGVNFQRRIRRKNEASHWSPIPRPFRFNRVSRAGRLEGLSGIRPGRNLYVKPYITAPVLRRREDDVDFVPDMGFDIKYGLNSQLTLDLTVNTDFSQVEADDEQINLTRFSLFFPEKREFFLENATIFEFGPGSVGGPPGIFREFIPFFSRRIGISKAKLVPILGGARLSGRTGEYTLGFLSLQVDESGESPSTNFSVVRVRRDILRKSDIGGLFISKHETGGHFNRTYGADVNFTFFDFLNVSSFLVKTTTPEIRDQDLAGYLSAAWTDSLLTLQASYLSVQDNVNPEVGFVPRKGIRKSSGRFGVRPRPRERIAFIREFEPLISAEYITNQDNILETRNVEGRFTIRFQNGGFIWLAGKSNFERLTEPFPIRTNQVIPVGDYSFNEYTLSFLSDQSRMFSGGFRVGTGGFFDGDKNSYRLTGRFQQPQFQVELSWSHDDVSLPSGDFDTDLLATRLNYSFNTSMFLNALIQYNSDLREIGSNIRFNLIHKPLSDFFLVYNERRSSTGEVAERALIAKLTYVFNF